MNFAESFCREQKLGQRRRASGRNLVISLLTEDGLQDEGTVASEEREV